MLIEKSVESIREKIEEWRFRSPKFRSVVVGRDVHRSSIIAFCGQMSARHLESKARERSIRPPNASKEE